MIWITGDTHANFHRFTTDNFPEQKEMTKADTVIICGDFGGVWRSNSPIFTMYIKEEEWWLDWLENKPFTVAFVDGNHENHWRLAEYPVKEWNGGKVHEIRPHVLHLMRGEIYEIEGKKFFAFGGASSHDIQHGIIDSADEDWRDQCRHLDRQGKYMYRIKGLSWWPEELPSDEEMVNGVRNLGKHGWKVDFIITHTPPASIVAILGHGLYEQDVLTRYLEEIRGKMIFKKHFFGHMHDNRNLNDRDVLLYEQIIRIV